MLQSIFKQAVKLGLIPETPAKTEKLTIPKVRQPKIEIFSKQEAAQMLACLETEDIQFQTLIQLAIFMGARRGTAYGTGNFTACGTHRLHCCSMPA